MAVFGLSFCACLKIEFSLSVLNFYEYSLSKRLILETMSHFGLKIDFTGKLGVRTQYQEFQVPQLVVEVTQSAQDKDPMSEDPLDLDQILDSPNIESQHPSKVSTSNPKSKDQMSSQESDSLDKSANPLKPSQPRLISLESMEDNILYETPVFTSVLQAEKESSPGLCGDYYSTVNVEDVKRISKEQKQPGISSEASICILALIKNLMKSRPLEDMLREEIKTYVEKSLERYSAWSVLLNYLLIRSDLEFKNYKRMGRAMMQYEAVMEDTEKKEGGLVSRLKHMFSIGYPSYIEVAKGLANNYLRMNSNMSAGLIYEQVIILYVGCILCLGFRKYS